MRLTKEEYQHYKKITDSGGPKNWSTAMHYHQLEDAAKRYELAKQKGSKRIKDDIIELLKVKLESEKELQIKLQEIQAKQEQLKNLLDDLENLKDLGE